MGRWVKYSIAHGRNIYLVVGKIGEILYVRKVIMSAVATDKKDMTRVRANTLADRVEEGAELLAAFAEQLTEEEWKMVVTATDQRTVGVTVHHVANMYPIEVDVVRTIAGGNAITDVTWEVVADINAKHAIEQANVTKSEAVALLRKNSREAAEAIRELTDEQLDAAAPFSLSFGAPVTAQFVIEDHPLRHAWHHLARIRKAVGK